MTPFRRIALLLPCLLLSACEMVVLDPAGDVALPELYLVVFRMRG